MKIGFIGQGYIGKNYADDFERRGFTVVRYALEEPYVHNKSEIKECEIVFIAVPTPTTAETFDAHLVEETLSLVGKAKVAVIKSTLIPGTTHTLQAKFPDILVLHSPEFLSRASAKEDTERPKRNIIGIGNESPLHREKAALVLSILPKAPYELITTSNESELIKYINNTFFYTKTVFMNIMYDMAVAHGCSWEHIHEAMKHEPWIGESHTNPIHQSGRGAGGPCLIKDFSAFLSAYKETVSDAAGLRVLEALESKNLELLRSTNKDQDEVGHVYGTHTI